MGGLFAQFNLDSRGEYVVQQAGLKLLPAVQMAINIINDKNDGLYDELLPRTKVRYSARIFRISIIVMFQKFERWCYVSRLCVHNVCCCVSSLNCLSEILRCKRHMQPMRLLTSLISAALGLLGPRILVHQLNLSKVYRSDQSTAQLSGIRRPVQDLTNLDFRSM